MPIKIENANTGANLRPVNGSGGLITWDGINGNINFLLVCVPYTCELENSFLAELLEKAPAWKEEAGRDFLRLSREVEIRFFSRNCINGPSVRLALKSASYYMFQVVTDGQDVILNRLKGVYDHSQTIRAEVREETKKRCFLREAKTGFYQVKLPAVKDYEDGLFCYQIGGSDISYPVTKAMLGRTFWIKSDEPPKFISRRGYIITSRADADAD